jgi:hypothetical protein
MRQFTLIAITIFSFYKSSFSQNATMTIKNKSDRHVDIKLMQGPERKAFVYKLDSIAPKSTLVLNVYNTGLYFTKLRAILYDKKDPSKNDTIYSKNRPLQLTSDNKRGHSNVTIEFTVKESKNESLSITRKEYDN